MVMEYLDLMMQIYFMDSGKRVIMNMGTKDLMVEE
jgi:hypothetical protein